MRTLVHLSDLHFGSVDPALIEPLLAAVAAVAADVVAVSGDLTQRARKKQFQEARDSLASRRRASSFPAITTFRSTASGSAF